MISRHGTMRPSAPAASGGAAASSDDAADDEGDWDRGGDPPAFVSSGQEEKEEEEEEGSPNTHPISVEALVSARLVEDVERETDREAGAGGGGGGGALVAYVDQTPLVVAKKEGAITVNVRDRRVQITLAALCLAVMGGAISGALVATTTKTITATKKISSPTPALPQSPSESPSLNPTRLSWEQAGRNVLGQFYFDRFGWSVSVSSDGSRFVASAPQGSTDQNPTATVGGYVRVYDYIRGDWVLAGEIPKPYDFIDDDYSRENHGEVVATLVSISGDGTTLAVGYPPRENGTAGFVQVFRNVPGDDGSGGNWTSLGEEIWGAAHEERFGGLWEWADDDLYGPYYYDYARQAVSSLCLSSDGRMLAIGSPKDETGGIPEVRVYTLVETNEKATGVESRWVQQGGDIVGTNPTSRFGQAVSLSADGRRIAIGDLNREFWQNDFDTSQRDDYGYVKIYKYDGPSQTWKQLGQQLEGLPVSYANYLRIGEFGSAVSISGDGTTVAAAASNRNSDDECPGVVLVHRYDEGSDEWEQLGDFIWQNGINCTIVHATKLYGATFDSTGYAVSLSHDGSRLAVGMGSDDILPHNLGRDDYYQDFGTVVVYDFDGNDWVQIGDVITGAGRNDLAGWSISLSSDGRRVVVGSPLNQENGNDSGQARVFELTGV